MKSLILRKRPTPTLMPTITPTISAILVSSSRAESSSPPSNGQLITICTSVGSALLFVLVLVAIRCDMFGSQTMALKIVKVVAKSLVPENVKNSKDKLRGLGTANTDDLDDDCLPTRLKNEISSGESSNPFRSQLGRSNQPCTTRYEYL